MISRSRADTRETSLVKSFLNDRLNDTDVLESISLVRYDERKIEIPFAANVLAVTYRVNLR